MRSSDVVWLKCWRHLILICILGFIPLLWLRILGRRCGIVHVLLYDLLSSHKQGIDNIVSNDVETTRESRPGLVVLDKARIRRIFLIGFAFLLHLVFWLLLFRTLFALLIDVTHRQFRAIFGNSFSPLSNKLSPWGRLPLLVEILSILSQGLFREPDLIFLGLNYLQSDLLLLKFCFFVERIHDLPEFVSVDNSAALVLHVLAGLSQKAVKLLILALSDSSSRLCVVAQDVEVEKHLKVGWRGT